MARGVLRDSNGADELKTPPPTKRTGGGATALRSPLASPAGRARGVLSPNDDASERAAARAAKAAAARRRRNPEESEADPEASESPVPARPAPVVAPQRAAAPPVRQSLKTGQVLELYANCIKLASENKINAKNTWSLSLIDHLSDIVKLEREEDDTTNFQKASCTLDAGVKIYSTRVDAVHTDTFKVLGGLNRSSTQGPEAGSGDGAGLEEDDDETQGDEGEDEDGAAAKKARKTTKAERAASTTLEPAENHTVKSLESAVTVDPLFQKTSAQFDEGGARGLLLNNLGVHRGCTVVFDSEEVPDYAGEAEGASDADVELTLDANMLGQLATLSPDDAVAAAFTPSLGRLTTLLKRGGRAALGGDAAGDDGDEDAPEEHAGSDAFDAFAMGSPGTSSVGGGAGAAEMDDDEDFFFGSGAPDAPDDDGAFGREPAGPGDAGAGHVLGGTAALEWVVSAEGVVGRPRAAAWAGPSHWRFSSARPKVVDAASEQDDGAAEPKEKKRVKGAPYFDFENLPQLSEDAFELARRASETTLAANQPAVDTLLPSDLGYGASNLVRLFLKPNAVLGAARASAGAGGSFDSGAADGDGGLFFGAGFDDDCDDFDGGDAAAGGWEAPVAGSDELVAAPRRVEKIEVAYARTAKQVDVRVLKETLWTGLREGAAESQPDEEDERQVNFDELLGGVSQDCQAGNMGDLSVHMCFICVLHLANEHGLAIHDVDTLDQLTVTVPPAALAA